ncbi:MAG TPA: choice-of-anchor J domain-containing protein, partial [Aggregatilineaceae bacterium]|nr:choice-of-anchor J domain-containing protein [Aggregatilineaceae bacterium]
MNSHSTSRPTALALIASVVLLACSSTGPSAATPSSPDRAPTARRLSPTPMPVALSPGDDTLAVVQNTFIPQRDRIDLARRLLGVKDIPEPPSATPPERQVGDEVAFWADNLQDDYSFQVQARLVYKTPHVYMFVEDGHKVSAQAIEQSADTFENVIIPKMHEVFGTEWSPGIDGDPHLYILHTSRLGGWVAAYFGSTSEYPVQAVPNSNQHEMFFVNLDSMGSLVGSAYYEAVLTHEYQHMIHWSVDENEDTWMNEGLSELAPMVLGYGASDFAPLFLQVPNIQLNTWPEGGDRGVHYGAAFLFLAHFYGRYGAKATSTLVRDPANGLASVADTLRAIGAADSATGDPVTLENLFGDWLVTNLLQDPSVGDGRYAYPFPAMQRLPTAAITQDLRSDGVPVYLQAPQWGADYLRVAGRAQTQTLRLAFKGTHTVPVVPAQAHGGTYVWWSNRGDDSDMRLTRAFDLTGVSQATLKFWTWYSIENLWDYGYVMVSTDGGATWTPLPATHTAAEDPHKVAYGHGYTGLSNGWVQETVDLTPYAGQHVLVRFEYITDDATTQPGMLVDDVSIPEIGYQDGFEN